MKTKEKKSSSVQKFPRIRFRVKNLASFLEFLSEDQKKSSSVQKFPRIRFRVKNLASFLEFLSEDPKKGLQFKNFHKFVFVSKFLCVFRPKFVFVRVFTNSLVKTQKKGLSQNL